MSNYFTAKNNASIYNFKNLYNSLAIALAKQGTENLIKNSRLNETVGSNIHSWQTSGWDINTPDSVDISGFKTYTIPANGWFRQSLNLNLGKVYTGILLVDSTDDVLLKIYGGSDDIFDLKTNLQDTTALTVNGFAETRFKTRETSFDATALFNSQIYFEVRNTTGSPLKVTLLGTFLIEGEVANTAVKERKYESDNLRYNDTLSHWEVSYDNGTTWERVYTDGTVFDNYILALLNTKMTDYVHKDNIVGGAGISINRSLAGDGTSVLITISSSGGSGGSGDWTREDVVYESILNRSDYFKVTYDTFIDNNVTTFGSISYNDTVDIYGTGRFVGLAGSGIITKNLIFDETDISSFMVHAIYEGDVNLDYSVSSDGTNWGPWNSCSFDTNVYLPSPTNYLRLRFTCNVSTTTLYSFGLFYSHSTYAAGEAFSFQENYTIPSDNTSPYIIVIPNEKWYHKDGKSLQVFRNGIKLYEGIDYTETDVGFVERSNTVTILSDVTTGEIFQFQEYFGHVDAGADNYNLINSHINDTTSNPHNITPALIGAIDSTVLNSTLSLHTGNTSVGIHGSSITVVPNTLVHRDNNGKIQVEDGTVGKEAINISQFPFFNSTTEGFAKLPNGIEFKWGKSSIISTPGTYQVTFSTPFSQTTLNVQLTRIKATITNSFGLSVENVDRFGFRIYSNSANNDLVYWFAIGV